MLNEKNYKILCAKNYQSLDIDSFREDLARVNKIKKILYKYAECGTINERLLLNHIIILYNMFGNFATDILYFSIDVELYTILNTFILFLDRLPDDKYMYGFDFEIGKLLEII